MRIAQGDKDAIITKVTATLVIAAKAKLPDPKQLLIDIYVEWFDINVAPYIKHSLYNLIPKPDDAHLKFADIKLNAFADNPGQYTDPMHTNTKRHIAKAMLPVGYDVLSCDTNTYSDSTTIDVSKLSCFGKLQQYDIDISNYKAGIQQERTKLITALEQLNTFKKLETQLPVIFNAMPQGIKEKYAQYKQRVRDAALARKTRAPEKAVEDFTSLGTTLAVEALKDATR